MPASAAAYKIFLNSATCRYISEALHNNTSKCEKLHFAVNPRKVHISKLEWSLFERSRRAKWSRLWPRSKFAARINVFPIARETRRVINGECKNPFNNCQLLDILKKVRCYILDLSRLPWVIIISPCSLSIRISCVKNLRHPINYCQIFSPCFL